MTSRRPPVPPQERKELARWRLEIAGRHWHKTMGHPGEYDECPEQTCYHTNSAVAK